jgi:hypothetical protein
MDSEFGEGPIHFGLTTSDAAPAHEVGFLMSRPYSMILGNGTWH